MDPPSWPQIFRASHTTHVGCMASRGTQQVQSWFLILSGFSQRNVFSHQSILDTPAPCNSQQKRSLKVNDWEDFYFFKKKGNGLIFPWSCQFRFGLYLYNPWWLMVLLRHRGGFGGISCWHVLEADDHDILVATDKVQGLQEVEATPHVDSKHPRLLKNWFIRSGRLYSPYRDILIILYIYKYIYILYICISFLKYLYIHNM